MVLIPEELLTKIPPIGKTADEANPMVWVKLFYPDFSWTWYIIEYDGSDLCFGYVEGFENELGSFSLKELQTHRGKLGLPLERARYWKPRRLSKLQK